MPCNDLYLMKATIALKIKPIFVKDVTGNLPADTQYKIAYAKAELIGIKEGTVLRQYCPNYHFYIELYECRLKREVHLSYDVLCRQLFMFFMLEGAISFTDDIGETLRDASKGICYATVNAEGEYNALLDKGTHVLLYMTPRHDWLRSTNRFPKIVAFLNESESKGFPVTFMNKTVLNRQLYNSLVRLWRVEPDREDDPEAVLLSLFKQVLAGYHDAQVAGNYLPFLSPEDKLAEVCQHLDHHFLQADIMDLTRLAERFYMSPHTLRRLFKRLRQTTVRAHVEGKRLEYAHKLLTETNEPIQAIAKLCGFNSSNYFSRLFRKKYFCCPKDVRNGQ